MRSRRATSEHQEAVSRRLAQLSAELAATRGDDAPAPAVGGAWWEEHTHVAGQRPPLALVSPDESAPVVAPVTPSPPGPAPAVAAPAVPEPGRHAARRSSRLVGSVPDPLRGRVALGPAQLAVLAMLVAVGLAVTAWWVVRGDPRPVVPSAPVAAPASDLVSLPVDVAPSAPSAGVAGATAASAEVTVDVSGKVRRPGIAVLAVGSRVVDALEAAGGVRPGVDLSSINLARPLVDGEQILVGQPAASGGVLVPPVPVDPNAPVALVNLNLASLTELETLPEVGPVTAQAIVTWREDRGGFTAVDELLEVDGIGDATHGL
ncbi:MAG: ComEA family DNA-binding protein [Nocardioides sp.]